MSYRCQLRLGKIRLKLLWFQHVRIVWEWFCFNMWLTEKHLSHGSFWAMEELWQREVDTGHFQGSWAIILLDHRVIQPRGHCFYLSWSIQKALLTCLCHSFTDGTEAGKGKDSGQFSHRILRTLNDPHSPPKSLHTGLSWDLQNLGVSYQSLKLEQQGARGADKPGLRKWEPKTNKNH